MEFDKNKLFTCLNASELKKGSTGIFSDILGDLISQIEEGIYSLHELDVIDKGYCGRSFQNEYGDWYQFFYLVKKPEEKHYRPFNTCDEVESVLHFGDRIIDKDFPNDRVYYIGCEEVGHIKEVVVSLSTLKAESVEDLLKNYVTADGRPLGIEVQ